MKMSIARKIINIIVNANEGQIQLSDRELKVQSGIDINKMKQHIKKIGGVLNIVKEKIKIVINSESQFDDVLTIYNTSLTKYSISIYANDTKRYLFKNNID
jgi:hypothetical protein